MIVGRSFGERGRGCDAIVGELPGGRSMARLRCGARSVLGHGWQRVRRERKRGRIVGSIALAVAITAVGLPSRPGSANSSPLLGVQLG